MEQNIPASPLILRIDCFRLSIVWLQCNKTTQSHFKKNEFEKDASEIFRIRIPRYMSR